MVQSSRFYIFTGKGGVGKTTLSVAFTKYLQENNKKVVLAYFKNSKIDDDNNEIQELVKLSNTQGLDLLALDLADSAKMYMGKRLKSPTIAKWIIKTPFFKSLINMIPGFNYLIFLGRILELLEEDPELIIVLDAPASGHALTMLESTRNFNEIFRKGILYNDTNRMREKLTQKGHTKINIATLPSTLAINEALELTSDINKIDNYHSEIYCNNVISNLQVKCPPEFLSEKLKIEKEALALAGEKISHTISYSLEQGQDLVIKDLVPSMKNLV
jgi:anion-transporting  ArsA/GET3 family ATPase